MPGAARARWGGLLPGAVLAAAFIGPGTVTTCAKSGAEFGSTLLWALVFSTFACVVLQEAVARLATATGDDLGCALRARFKGFTGQCVTLLVLGAIVAGCAAYQTGNIVGAIVGARLRLPGSNLFWVAVVAFPALLLLWFAATATVVRVLAAVVALMGVLFVAAALALGPVWGEILRGALVPTLPGGASFLVLALIGTTVVPYNLFLGAGLARGRNLREMRNGLIVAIAGGGMISVAIVVVGSGLEGSFSFAALERMLVSQLGDWAAFAFAAGLAVAGFSSALTAPLAAALTARGLFEHDGETRWSTRSWRYRLVWGGVLASGVLFAGLDVRPAPAILAAQALNGTILPLVAVFLFVVVNDGRAMGPWRNGWRGNVALYVCVAVSVLLGVFAVLRALAATLGVALEGAREVLVVASIVLLLVSYPMLRAMRRT